VKGLPAICGQTLTPGRLRMRDLRGVVDREKAAIGVLITPKTDVS
jgi:hypothetical protein